MKQRTIKLDNIEVSNSKPVIFIGGPCVIEDAGLVMETALELKNISRRLKIPFVFKSSYDKANRLSGKSFRGPGLKKGVKILEKIKSKLDIPILTDIHTCGEIPVVSRIVDILQIPAFLCRQTDLVISAAETGKVVNIKKGQFISPGDMKFISEKASSTGNHNIMLTERGTFFGYSNLVVDMRSIPSMKKHGYPVIFDATHSVQLPGKAENHSGGEIWNSLPLSKSAVILGVAGIYAEVHPSPRKARSDAKNQLKINNVSSFLKEIIRIDKCAKNV